MESLKQRDDIPIKSAPATANGITPPFFSDSLNARSKPITTATGSDTYGTLNQHLPSNLAFQVGIHDSKGKRRTMEDAHSFVVDFSGVRGQGYFAVFDGHAGKYAAEWCGQHFHEHLLDQLRSNPDLPIPDILNNTYHAVDYQLSDMAKADDKMHSGCTAVTAFLRIEDAESKQSFLDKIVHDTKPSQHTESPLNDEDQENKPPPSTPVKVPYATPDPSSDSSSPGSSPRSGSPNASKKKNRKSSKGSKIMSAIRSFTGSQSDIVLAKEAEADVKTKQLPRAVTPVGPNLRRVLYTANAGDARAVLCRAGEAVRLTYDHKGNDPQEAQRVREAGGFLTMNRVAGVLAVTRSLGDPSVKAYVVGSPYTTEVELCPDDEFLILACDGLWDVLSDQKAVNVVRNTLDPQVAARQLVELALDQSTDNITIIVVRFPSVSS